jgi:calcium/calmodulin-dependent protein kinase (CaM kinase) II
MSDTTTNELLALNRRLLEGIAAGDWATYEELCDPSLTCFEPEARGQWVEGMDFHHFYFKLGGVAGPVNITVSTPHVRVMGDVAVISFIRLVQKLDASGNPITARSEETRIWQRQGGRWRHVHFHRTVG